MLTIDIENKHYLQLFALQLNKAEQYSNFISTVFMLLSPIWYITRMIINFLLKHGTLSDRVHVGKALLFSSALVISFITCHS